MEQLDISKSFPHSLSHSHNLSNSLCLLQGLQSIYPSNHRSIDQYIDCLINPLVNPSIHQSIDSSIHRSFDWSIHPSVHPLIRPSIHNSINLPIDQSIHRSINQSINALIDRSIDPSIYRLWPMSWIVSPRLQHIVISYLVEGLIFLLLMGGTPVTISSSRRGQNSCATLAFTFPSRNSLSFFFPFVV